MHVHHLAKGTGVATIPEEAVEVAAKVFYQDGWVGPPFWESLDADDTSKLEYLATARLALEAAAPHMACAETTAADRDRLAEVIWGVEAEDIGTFKTGVTSKAAARIASAILAAGYRKAAK